MRRKLDNVQADMHCPTWSYYYAGWRKILAGVWIPYPVVRIELRSLFLFRKYLKKEKDRVFYKVGDITVCSYENYAWLEKSNKE